jgi:hypothetical protein
MAENLRVMLVAENKKNVRLLAHRVHSFQIFCLPWPEEYV